MGGGVSGSVTSFFFFGGGGGSKCVTECDRGVGGS